uniref:Uncharacterized protein n=1 Tax=Hucho hucho TaxID=62062 RepID=A0A4W5MHF1_9TELE
RLLLVSHVSPLLPLLCVSHFSPLLPLLCVSVKVQKSDNPHSWDPCVNYCPPQHPSSHCKPNTNTWTTSSNPSSTQEYCKSLVPTNFSPGSTTTTSGPGSTSQISSTLPRTAVPMSPRNSMMKRRQRKKEHKSSCTYCMVFKSLPH